MKFFKWLKEELIENFGILLLSLALAFVAVLAFNMML